MYAIIQAEAEKPEGKQVRVEVGDVIDIDLFETTSESSIEFKNVLFFNDGKESKVGTPYVSDVIVKGEVVQECAKGEKIISYKFKRRQNYHRKIGHRQKYTRVKITAIEAN
jgi:large subunit ribosomal protein L21